MLKQNPDNREAYYGRGSAYNGMGRYDVAIKDFTRAIELDSGYAEALYGRGSAYLKKGLEALAIKDYTTAIRLKPELVAGEDYIKAIEPRPEYASLYYERGKAHSSKDQHDLAIEEFSKAIELNPVLIHVFQVLAEGPSWQKEQDLWSQWRRVSHCRRTWRFSVQRREPT